MLVYHLPTLGSTQSGGRVIAMIYSRHGNTQDGCQRDGGAKRDVPLAALCSGWHLKGQMEKYGILKKG